MAKRRTTKKKTSKRLAKSKSSGVIDRESQNSRELLMDAARRQFAKNGFDRTSIRDIAKDAGVNISLISYHFDGKDGIYRKCLEELSKEGLDTVERVLNKPLNVEEFKTRLHIFIGEFIRLHLRNPENACIILREISEGTSSPIALELMKTKLRPVFDRLVDFISYAQKEKMMNSALDPSLIATLLMGCITHLIRTEGLRVKIFEEHGFLENKFIDNTIQQMTQIFWDGIQ